MSERITNGTFIGPLYNPPISWNFSTTCGPGVAATITFDEDLGDGENSCAIWNYGNLCEASLCQSVDFTDVNWLTFLGWFDSFQRFGPPNGTIRIFAGATLIYEHFVDDLYWRAYSIDVSAITGVHVLCFTGGAIADWRLHHVSAESAPPPTPPVAEFSGTPLSGVTPLSVQFTDLSSNTPDEWLWNFGDGYLSAAENPLHEYLTPGVFTVSLKATNAGGYDIEEKIDYVTVTAPPPVFSPAWSIRIGPV